MCMAITTTIDSRTFESGNGAQQTDPHQSCVCCLQPGHAWPSTTTDNKRTIYRNGPALSKTQKCTREPTVCATTTRVGTGSRERTNKCMCMATHCIRGNCYCMHACMHAQNNKRPPAGGCLSSSRALTLAHLIYTECNSFPKLKIPPPPPPPPEQLKCVFLLLQMGYFRDRCLALAR